jgi:hypothetical protein
MFFIDVLLSEYYINVEKGILEKEVFYAAAQ